MILTFDVEIPLRWKSSYGSAVPTGNDIRREFSSNRYRKNVKKNVILMDFSPCINSWYLLYLHLNIQPLKQLTLFFKQIINSHCKFFLFAFPLVPADFFNGVNDFKMVEAKLKKQAWEWF